MCGVEQEQKPVRIAHQAVADILSGFRPARLLSMAPYGLDGPPRDAAELWAVDFDDDGSIWLNVMLDCNVQIPLEDLLTVVNRKNELQELERNLRLEAEEQDKLEEQNLRREVEEEQNLRREVEEQVQ